MESLDNEKGGDNLFWTGATMEWHKKYTDCAFRVNYQYMYTDNWTLIHRD